MLEARQAETDGVQLMNRLLIQAVRALANEGQTDLACRIAAAAWAALHDVRPKEAEKLNGVLHYLTRLDPSQRKEILMSNPEQLDVRRLPPPQRHALIFDACGKLPVGNADEALGADGTLVDADLHEAYREILVDLAGVRAAAPA